MALVLADRVRETTTTTGTGTITLAGAVAGFQSFAVIGTGNTTYYTINGGAEWEVGIGTYTSSGTTLSRDTVLASSNAGALVNFSAGIKDVFVTYPAGKSVNYDSSGNVGIGTTSPNTKLDVVGNVIIGAALTTGTGASTGDVRVELGANRTGDGPCYIDWHSTAGTDFECRVIRNSGVNGTMDIQNTGTGGINLSNLGSAPITLNTAGAERMRIDSNGAIDSPPTYNNTATGSTVVVTSAGQIRRTSSSIKYKKDVEDLDPSLVANAVSNLRPVYYRTKNAEGDDKATWSHVGLIAEEVHEVEPRLVRYRTVEVVADEEGNRVERELEVPEPEDVDYARLSVLLLAKVKELETRIAVLEAR